MRRANLRRPLAPRAAIRALRLRGAFELAVWCLAAWVIYMANAFTGVLFGQESLMLFLWFLLGIPVALAALPERAPGRGVRT